MKKVSLVAVIISIFIAGCGTTAYVTPESARTPEGAKPQAPPITFSVSPNAKHINQAGLTLIENFEGWSSCPYWDSYGRVYTRGYGETEGINGASPCISRAFGQSHLQGLVESRYEWSIRALGYPFSQNAWNALSSFVWNLGGGIFT